MGKTEEEQPLPVGLSSELSGRNVGSRCGGGCCGIRRLIAVRCIFFLLLSAAVFLSAVFLLPPFLSYADQPDPAHNFPFRDHEIVASFHAWKPVSFLEDHILELEDSIFGEIPVPFAKVAILSLQSLGESNATKVVFAVDPDTKYSKIPPTSQSLIKETFETMVINQPPLHLPASLFGNTSLFQVLKFTGGITIIPPQSAFLLQKAQIYFNFTLNYSIYQIQVNFDNLTSQLRSGLHLSSFENLYVSLSNGRGSTMDAPTIVQSSVLMAIGTNPSKQRLKQLAQTIRNSNSGNLGLNNTIFGKVKQVRLSSVLNHSLSGSSTGQLPSPAPLPHHHHHHHHHQQHHHHHHHHHPHHHHHHHHNAAYSPSPRTEDDTPATQNGASAPNAGSSSPVKSPAPMKKLYEATPPACEYAYRRSSTKLRKQFRLGPITAPSDPPLSPYVQVDPPAPAIDSISASRPLPGLVLSNVQPPEKGSRRTENFERRAPSVLPSEFSSSAGVRVHIIR